MTDHRWNPRTVPHIDAFRSGYLMVGIKCDEAMLQEIDRDGRIVRFPASQIREAFNTICDERRSRGQEIFLRHISPMAIFYHLKRAQANDCVRQSDSEQTDPNVLLACDALKIYEKLPQLAQDFAKHIYEHSEEGIKASKAFEGMKYIGWLKERGARWGAAFTAARIMRNEQHPRYGEMMRLVEAGTDEATTHQNTE